MRVFGYTIAIFLLIVGSLLAWSGSRAIFVVPHFLIGGLSLLVLLYYERWRYKPIQQVRPKPSWIDTGERFTDPETEKQVAVYLDGPSGERHYIEVQH